MSISIFQPAFMQQEEKDESQWFHEYSGLPVDDRIHYASLENGFRYAWMENKKPENRCFLRLHVAVGSFHEEESEIGIAHYLEHMAFNGSKNFAPGTLIEWFQNQGMSFGSDTNAHTNHSETVYKINLAKCDEQSLKSGLLVFRDFADGLLLRQEDVEKERGIIDREDSGRAGAQSNIQTTIQKNIYEGTLLPKRNIIGEKKLRDTFTAEHLRKFYKKWYRPERMTLVLTGDLNGFNPSEAILEKFESMERSTDVVREPEIGTPTLEKTSLGIFEPEMSVVKINVERIKVSKSEGSYKEQLLGEIPINVAITLVNERIGALLRKNEAPFLGAGIYRSSSFGVDSFGMQVTTSKEAWRESLIAVEHELRRALEFGFNAEELERMKVNNKIGFEQSIAHEATYESQAFAEVILSEVRKQDVPMRSLARKDVFMPVFEQLTPESCQEALRTVWSDGALSFISVGNLDLGDDAAAILRSAYEDAAREAVMAKEHESIREFAYASSGEKGKILSMDELHSEAAVKITFANGIRAMVKHMPHVAVNQVVVLIGEQGLSLNDGKNVALLNVPGSIVMQGGLKAHDLGEIQKILTGRVVGADLSISHDFLTFSGAASSNDLILQMELLKAFVEYPAFREEPFLRWKKALTPAYESQRTSYEGPINANFMGEFYNNDPRFRFVHQGEFENLNLSDLATYLIPRLQNEPISIIIVGNASVDSMVESLAKTFGTMNRDSLVRLDEMQCDKEPLLVGGLKREYNIASASLETSVRMFLPIISERNADSREAFMVLGEVIEESVRLALRESLGAVYTPSVGLTQIGGKDHPGRYLLRIDFMTAPEQTELAMSAVKVRLRKLAVEGVTSELVERRRKPIFAQIAQARESAGYWISILADLLHPQSEREPLESEKEDRYRKISVDDINSLAKRFLVPEQISTAIVSTNAQSQSLAN